MKRLIEWLDVKAQEALGCALAIAICVFDEWLESEYRRQDDDT